MTSPFNRSMISDVAGVLVQRALKSQVLAVPMNPPSCSTVGPTSMSTRLVEEGLADLDASGAPTSEQVVARVARPLYRAIR